MTYHINIEHHNQVFCLFVKADGEKYQVFQKDKLLGSIYPDISTGFVSWASPDLIAPGIVNSIGNEIEKQDF